MAEGFIFRFIIIIIFFLFEPGIVEKAYGYEDEPYQKMKCPSGKEESL